MGDVGTADPRTARDLDVPSRAIASVKAGRARGFGYRWPVGCLPVGRLPVERLSVGCLPVEYPPVDTCRSNT